MGAFLLSASPSDQYADWPFVCPLSSSQARHQAVHRYKTGMHRHRASLTSVGSTSASAESRQEGSGSRGGERLRGPAASRGGMGGRGIAANDVFDHKYAAKRRRRWVYAPNRSTPATSGHFWALSWRWLIDARFFPFPNRLHTYDGGGESGECPPLWSLVSVDFSRGITWATCSELREGGMEGGNRGNGLRILGVVADILLQGSPLEQALANSLSALQSKRFARDALIELDTRSFAPFPDGAM